MTLLFSDLVGSTVLSERVEPEQLRDLFACYRAARGRRCPGTAAPGAVPGDGILAGFGHPSPTRTTHGGRCSPASISSLAMRDAHAELGPAFGAAPEVRVGIHTGRVVVTDLSDDGSVAERDSIVGLVPNLAARIQQAADPGTVVISDVTRQLVDADFFLHLSASAG